MSRIAAYRPSPARIGLLALTFVWTGLAAVPPATAAADPRVEAIEPAFDWAMPERFGIDQDRDGLVDMPNRASYVHGTSDLGCNPTCPPATFPVTFDAHLGGDLGPGSFPSVRYEWTLVPASGPPQRHSRHATRVVARLPEGPVTVTLRVVVDLPFRRFGFSTTDVIDVEDVLVVAIGDSYASGEGNPERRREGGIGPAWGDGLGDPAVEADHATARRSALAWPAQLAIDLERWDPHSSVTFVSLAASSATVDAGLLGPQNSRLPVPQVERVAAMVGERDIDLLLLNIGGNDIGFSRLIAGLVDADGWLDPICYENDLRNIWDSVNDGSWDRASRLSWRITDPFRIRCRTERVPDGVRLAGLAALPAELDRLAAAVAEALAPGLVLVMEYPDPTGFSTGPVHEICDEIVGDAAPLGLHEINREEQRLGRRNVLDPLNAAVESAAARHGWLYVGGVVEAFTDGHGYCAPWPDYENPGGSAGQRLVGDRLEQPDGWYRNGGIRGTEMVSGPISWYRTAGQSVALQGPDSRTDTTGTMHPNELGHRALANLALAVLGRR